MISWGYAKFLKMEYRRRGIAAKLTFLIREQIMPMQLITDLFI